MNEIASPNGKAAGTIAANGREYDVHPLTLADLGELQSWCDKQCPDPFEAVAKQLGTGRFNVAQEKYLLDAAVRQASEKRPRIGEPEADKHLRTFDGFKQILFLSIKRGLPSITLADIDKIADALDPSQMANALNASTADNHRLIV